MNLLRALFSKPRPPVSVVRQSSEAEEVAALLSRPRLDPELKDKIETVRARAIADTTPMTVGRMKGATAGKHAAAASSHEAKLAMLVALARWRGAKSALEIGTAYGISGIALGSVTRLTTVEAYEPQATLGPRNIASAGIEAECINGRKQEVIPQLVREGRQFDLVFHDGGHFGDSYVEDFEAMLPLLDSGAVFIVDDVFYDDSPEKRALTEPDSRRTCREGWSELLEHPRTTGAVLFEGKTGILLLAPA